ncbi:MAG TPA: D-alanyl-D-alanine carboxypeptidase/D-alanyl-D-alanine-endopeptidase [Frankiaceae bacterium]|nr:D-alanyl-D-alanine carboxypeptidase/D-alanyl-D-alanine-endopeptidase [Frankiaceae bacterium]
MPDPRRLASALRGPLSDHGFSGAPQLDVADLTTGQPLFSQDAQTPEAPASTAKLLIAAAVLHQLGPQARLQTKAYVAGGTIYLVGGGDPTLAPSRVRTEQLTHGQLDDPANLDDLAQQVRKAGVTHADHVVGDAGLFTGPPAAVGWQPYYLQSQVAPVAALTVQERRATTPSVAATEEMRHALGAAGVTVGGSGLGRVPPGARLVGTVSSPPLSALVQHMLAESDNDLAEALGRVLAVHAGRTGDFAGTASAVLDGLQQLGLSTAGVQMHDASGLSQADRVPPALLVDILRMASDPAHPELRPIVDGLPVAGRTGTLAPRYRTALTRAGAGVVHAKSGRLAGMNALAGLVKTKNGRVLVFALRAPTADLSSGEQAMDRVAATLAGCGCR